jgi:hypothetical protein
MGQRGPVPNRSEDLSRDRDSDRGDRAPISRGQSRPAIIPDPDPEWHRVASMLWTAALASGQSDFYQSSDYAYLYHVCDELSAYKGAEGRRAHSAMMFAALNQAMTVLLLTEGDRRRVRIELQDEDNSEDDAVVSQMDDYRQGLRAV